MLLVLAAPLGVPAASAAPVTPESGLNSGGTEVTLQLPVSKKFVQVIGDGGTGGFTLALGDDGTVWANGDNSSGQLGVNGTSSVSGLPRRQTQAGLPRFSSVETSARNRSFALDEGGKIWAWGSSTNLGLGLPGVADTTVPTRLTTPEGTKFVDVAGGAFHGLALDEDGAIWAWGINSKGELGVNGTTNVSTGPMKLAKPGLPKFAQVAAGEQYSLALDEDGAIWAWGINDFGQLGVNGKTDVTTGPMRLTKAGLPRFTQVVAGVRGVSLALDENGAIWGWGLNISGQLGVNGTTDVTTGPMQQTKSGLPEFTQISAGASSGYALTAGGVVWAWGGNNVGQLGVNGTTNVTTGPTPQTKPGLPAFVSVAALGTGGSAVTADGVIWVWGGNSVGELGVNGTTNVTTGPVQRPAPTTQVISATFGGAAATGIAAGTGFGEWEATTPAHAPGKVDVALVNWRINGYTQPAYTITDGFEYLSEVQVSIEAKVYRELAHTNEILEGTVVAPGTSLYWVYTVKNLGTVPVLIHELTSESTVLPHDTVCNAVAIAVGQSTTCTTQSTV